MSSVVAIVKSIVGQVFAVSPEGVRRVLIEGDRLLVGDQVDTGAAGAVTLELADGQTLDLGRDTQWSGSAPDSSSGLAEATAQAAPSVEELQQAIVAGADPTKDLEATAAGPTAAGTGGAAGGGHSFVMLDATAGRVAPTVGFPTDGPDFTATTTTLDTGSNQNTTVTNAPSVLTADTGTQAEDSVATGNVLNNDSDADTPLGVASFTVAGMTGSFTAGQTAAIVGVGTLTIGTNGNYTFTPDANYNGAVPQVTYTTNTGLTSTLDLTVTAVDDPSVLTADTQTIAEDTPAIGNVLSNDSDIDNVLSVATFTIAGVNATFTAGQTATIANVGTLVIAADGAYTFTPAANYNGTVPTVSYTVTDGSGTDVTSTLNISVTPVDDSFTDASETVTTSEDSPVTGSVLNGTSSVDGPVSVVNFTVGGTQYQAGETATITNVGTLVLAADGAYTFTPAANYNGTVPTVSYTVTDGSGSNVTSTLNISVTPVDDSFTDLSEIVTTSEDAPVTGSVLAGTSSVDGPVSVVNFTIGASTYAAGATATIANVGTLVLAADGAYTFTPAANYNGTVPTVGYTVTDGSGTDVTSTLNISVTPVDDSFTDLNETVTTSEDSPVTGSVLDGTSSVDGPVSVLNFTIGVTTYAAGDTATIANVGTLVIGANGAYTFTPAANYNGTVPTVSYTVTDGSGSNVTSTLNISVTPVDDSFTDLNETVTTSEDSPVTGSVLSGTSSVDGPVSMVNFTIGETTYAAGSTATIANVGTLVLAADGAYTFTPAANYNGTVPSVTYTVTDGSGSNVTSTLNISVTPVEDSFTDLSEIVTTSEDAPVTGSVLSGTSSVDGPVSVVNFTIGETTYAAGSTATIANVGTLVLAADGAYTFTPAANYNGTVPSVSYTVTDGSGTDVTSTLNISVTPVDDSFTDLNETVSTLEDTAVTGSVLDGTSSVDGPVSVLNFTIGASTYAAGATATIANVGTLVIAADGAYTFTPAANYNGTVPTVSYTITDGSGTDVTSTLNISVTPVDDSFTDLNETVSTLEDTALTGSVLDGTSSGDGPVSVLNFTVGGTQYLAGETATITNVGALMIGASGAYTFTPAANYNGTVPTVSYTVTDGSGGNDTSTLNISVTPVDDSFTDASETASTLEDTAVTGSVLDGTSSGDGPVSVLNFTVGGTQYLAGETATITNVGALMIGASGAYTFTPAANYNGSVPSVTYTVTDGSGTNDTSTLNISVTPVNDPSVLTADTNTVDEDHAATGNVLSNDHDVDNLLSVATFTVGGTEYAAGVPAIIANVGTLVIGANGAYTFTPDSNYNGTVPTVTYTTNTGSTSTLNISVTAVDDPSVLGADTQTVDEDHVATGNVLTNDSDVDNDLSVATFTVGGTEYAAGATPAIIANVGTLVIGASGAYTFTPAENWNGTVPTVTYTTNTGSTSTLDISVTPVNDPSVLTADTNTVDEDHAATGNVLTNDHDVDNLLSVATFTVGGTEYAAGATPAIIANVGTLVIGANGAYTFTPAENWNGTVPTVTYTTNTGSTSTLDISVTPVNDSSVLTADTQTVDEDQAATGNVLGNDSDVDNLLSVATFTVGGTEYTAGVPATIANVGTLVIGANGAYTFTPVENYNGTVPTVTYTTNTGSTSTLDISVTPVNDPSVLGADTQTVDEDHTATGNVLGNDHDVDNLLSVATFTVGGTEYAAGAPATIANVGTLVIGANGAYTFTPVENYNGTVPTVTYTTNTGSTSTLDISVTPVNDPSVLGADTNTVDEDHAATGNVLSNDSDVDNLLSVATFTVGGTEYTAGATSAIIANVGTLVIGASGAYTFTPDSNYNGTVPTVTYTTNTGSTSTLNISVTAVDDPSVLTADTQTVDEDHVATGNVLSNDSDVDNDLSVATFTVGGTEYAAGVPAIIANVGTLVIGANGAYAFTPVENWNGAVPQVTYTTNTGSTSTLDISVTPVNDPSVLTADTNTVDEDQAATGNVLGNDSDVDNLLSVATFTVGGTEYTAGATPAIIANVGSLTLGANGNYTFTPVENWNGTVPTVTYTTNTGSTSTLDISVTPVNDPSVLTADTNTVDEDHAATGNVLTNDHDVDNDLSVATFTVGGTEYTAGVPAIIANVGTLVIGANGAYTFTPAENWNGTVPTVTYTTNTGSTSTLDISVTPVNDPSVLTADTNTVDEDHAATGNVLTNDHDVDNDLSVATFTVGGTEYTAGVPAIIANVGTLVIGANGAYTFTPAENWNGTVPTVTYTTNTGSTSTLDISVTPVNDPSVLTADTNTVDEDHAATGNVLGNDSDVDNLLSVATFTVGGTEYAAGATPAIIANVGTLVIGASGAYTFTPDSNYNGTVPTVTYTTNTGSTSTLDISVTPVNDPSVLTADTNTVDEDQAATGNVLGNDSDVDNDLSVATFTVGGTEYAAGATPAIIANVGTLVIGANGAYAFTPVENWNGAVPQVTYTTNTGSTSTLDISVTPVNDPSVLGADTNTVDEDQAATGNVLGNDSDVDNLLSVATFTVGGTEYTAGATPAIIANVGTLVIGASGAYTFTPVENWNGTVPTVTYTTNTGSTSTLDISVTPVNDSSVLTADTQTVDEDQAATGNVLGNDSDVDNLLSVATFTVGGTEYTAGATPAIIANVGSLTLGANGNYTFTPAENWNGSVPTVTYTTNTGSTSTLDISVTPVNDPSVLTADTNTVDEDHAATGNVLGNDSDVDNLLSVATFTVGGTEYTAGATPAIIANVGTLVIGASGAYTFTPDSNYNGTVPTVTYTTNTGSTSTLDISVTPVNDPSVLTADTNTVDEDHAATGNVLGNDSDVDNLLSVSSFSVNGVDGSFTAGQTATMTGVGTLIIASNGAYTFTPAENWNGTVPTVTYTTNTGSTSTLDISVTAVDDPSVLGADTNTVDEDHAATGNVLGNDHDVDNLLSVSSFSVNGVDGSFTAGQTATMTGVGTLIIASNGAYTFTPVENYNGTVPTVTYTTNTGSTSTLNISVTAVDDPSVLGADTQTVDEDHAATGNVLTNDHDVDNLLSVSSFSVNGVDGSFTAGQTATMTGVGTLIIASNGAYTFTPAENWNGTVPTVTYTTNTGSTSTLDISVTAVDDPSVLGADTNTVDEDHAATGNVLGNDHDVDNLLSVSSFSVNGVDGSFTAGQTATMTGVGTLIIASNGAYTFTPVENYNGTVPTVTYTTNTGSTSTLNISVTAVDDPSVLGADTQTVDEDHAATGNVLTNDHDVDNLLSVSSFSVNGVDGSFTAGQTATMTGVGTLIIASNGAYTFTPVENYNGTVPTVTYTTNTGSTSTLDISVTPVNDPSVLTADTNTVDEDHAATGNVLGNDSDVDNLLSVATFTVGGTEYTAGATPAIIANVGTLVIGASGAYTFTPVENWNGTVPTVTYTTNTGSTSTLDISVTPVNDPSVLTADTNTVDEDHAATGNVLTNDHDVDNDLSVATFTVGGTEYAAGATPAIIANVGTLVIGASGAYTFTPVENWNGTVPTVTYTTNTGSTSTLDISVTPVNDPSVLTADTNTVDEDHAATGNVLGNDSDVDNLLSVSSFSVNGVDGSFTAGQTATMTGVGTLIIASNGAYTFTPAENWNGTVPTVTYTTNTGSTSTLDISVTPVNDPSVLTADTNTVDEDHAATGNVLTNDHDVDNLLSVSSFSVNGVDGSFTAGQTATMTGVGTLIIASNGAYTFTPAENWNGTVPTVTYTTNTGSTSTLDISVTPVNDPSVLGADTNTVDEDHAATGNVLGNDHDVDNLLSVATFTVGGTEYTAGATPAIIANVGTLVIGANGAYTFTPVENWNGTVPTVTYTTNTGSTSTLNISVTPVNDPSVLTADTNTVDEDHTATGNVLGNDSDVDNDLSVATFTVGGTEYTAGVPAIIANVGTLVIGANGAYTFTPAENWNGTVPTVTYTTNTGSTSTLDISVTPVNDPSVLTADTNTVDEDHAATGNVLTNDHDVDNLLSVSSFSVNGVDGSFTAGQTATMTGVGTLIIASNGAYTFTPDSNYNGTVPTVTYTTNTGSTSTLDISVTPVNDPSVLTADTNTVDEDHAATGNVLTNDHDVDNLLSVATFTVGGTEYTAGATPAIIANVGTLVIGANGAYTFTPVENWNGTVPTVTYTTNTGSTSTLDISVTPVNDSSVLTADTQTVDEDQAATGNVLGNDSDVDNLLSVATFTVGGTEYAAGATPAIIANVGTLVIGASGAYTFTPVENWNGTVPTVTYTTNTGSTSTLDISVTPVNDPSVLTADTNTVDEDQAATGNVLGNDSDVDNLLSVATFTVGGTEYTAGVPAIIANVGTLVIGANGAYTFTPDSNYNGTVPTVTYTTNTGSTSTLDISVTPVNDPSVLTADTNTVDEDHAATGNVLGNDSDVDNLLSVSSFSVNGVDGSFTAGQTATMTGVGTLIIASNGAYTFTPVENYNGTVPTVTYTTNTGSTSTLDISVTPVNDPSVLTADTNTVDEDHAATGNVLGNDSDVDNLLSVATFTVGGTEYTAGVPAIIANVGTLVIGANGAYTFTPAENWNGTVPTVTYTTNTGSTSTLDISVTPVNDPSVLTADTNTVDEDHVATGNVLGNDSDVDNLLSVSSFSVNGVDGSFTAGQTATMTGVGTLIIASNGAYTFTPAENYNGTVPTVTYTTNTGSTSTLDISVTAVDDPSVLTADTQTVDEDHVATGNVLSNDSDVDNDLSVATFTVGGTEYAAGVPAIIANVGTLVIGANGAYAFTPVENWNGAVPQVTYTTNTGSTSTLDISVTPVNDPSVLTADTNTVDEDQAATGNVLGNDSDVDNLLSVATFTVGGTEYTAGATPAIIANVGSLTLGANGNYTFTPVENWNGTVPTVTYTTNTGSTSTLDISVTPVNDPSVLTADTNTVDEDHAATGNVLTNDHDVDNDLSVATFTVGGTEYTAGVPAIIANVGTLVIGANGAYTFTPAENWNGTVPTVTYTTNTGSTSTLDISVTPVNDPSVLTADTNTVDEDHAATGNVLTNDHDVDNDLSVATFTVGGTEYTAGVPAIIANVGTLVIGANGAYTFTPAENWNGTVPTVTYTTNTGSTSTLDISVTPVNDPSVLTADTNTVDEDQAATGNVLGNDSDVDNLLSVATFTVGGTEYTAGATPAIIANVGTLVIGASGAYTFTPDSNYNGTVPTVTYTTNTGSTSTLDISVTPVNDPSVLGADTNTVDEDHAATGNVLTNDHDVDNLLSVATFTVGGTEYAAGATPAIIANVGTLVIGANGAYTFTPDSNYNGTVPTVTYTTNTGSTSTLDISVTPVNDPSVLTADTNTVDEDHAATGNVLTNDHDVDNLLSVATFTVGGTEYAAGATPAIIANVGTLVIGASGAYTFTPVENWNGAVPQVTYTTNTGSTSTLDISVTPVNDSSVLTADTNTVDEDHAATGNVLTNDHDVDNLLSVSSFSVNGVDGSFTAGQTATMTGVGTLIIASNGAYTFTPAENWNGTVPTVTYTTNTGSTSTLNISVTPVNDPSVLTADTNTVLEDNIATGNVLTNDRDVDNVLSVAKFTVSGTEYTAGGTATIANVGTLTLGANGNYTFTPVENWNGTVPTVTYTTNTGSTSTLNISVTPVNEAPTAAPVNVTGTEDTSLILGWSTFGVSDVDSPATSLGVKITGLPVEGKLQYLNGSTWTDLTPNQTITKADIDAGKLRFMPDANESGANGYNSGTGNNLADYAQIQFQPTDGTLLGSTGTIKIDITPVADAPTLNVASNNVTSTGLIKEVWTGLAGLGTNGNGAPSDTLKSVIDAAGTPNSSSTVGNVQSSGDVAAGTASKTSGLIYLEAGKTYTFSGSGDDSLLVTIGGKNVASALWGNGGTLTGSFTPTTSGYYTLDIYHHNQSGPGSYDVNLSVNGGAAVDLSSAGVPLYTGVADLVASGVTVSDLHGTNGEGYYDGYKLNTGAEGTSVHLSAITTALTDVDGSESLSVKISGIPAGAVLTDGAGHTFTATATSGEANVTGWTLSSLTVTPPAYYNGQFNLTVTSTSTELLGGSAPPSVATIPVTVYPATYNPITATSGDDVRDGTSGNDIVVADIGGLTVTPGQNYNIAFMVDSSGSMSSSSVTSAKNSLITVFTSLIASATSPNSSAGTVKVFLVDFDSQVNKSISIDLSKPGALDLLKGVLNSMQSGGYTNYEDVFKTTANWFKGPDALSNLNATNLTYFITDGEPTAYTKDEQTNPLVVDYKSNSATDLYLDNVLKQGSYTPGTEFRMIIGGESRVVVDSSGALYKWTEKSNNNWTSDKYSANNSTLQVHAQGDGTYELSDYVVSGDVDSSASNAASAFALFAAANSKVQAIGVNGDVSENDLAPYNTTDGKPLANINPEDLANAILGHSEATLPGKDTINGGDGNDIIFGDLVSFTGVTGEGYTALQAFVGKETGVETNQVTPSNVHQYVTEHYSTLDVSGAHDGDDTLLGGAGNDIIFGQGGDDKLYGGSGNDILLGGTGNDLLNGEAGNDFLIGGAGTDTLDGGAGIDTLLGGTGNDTLIGGLGGDTFVWKAGDTGTDVIKDFNANEGDRIDLRDLLQNESGSTIDNFLKITTAGGVSSLEVNSAGNFNSADATAAKADVTIKLEGNNWSSANLHNLIAGSDPTIKVDHNNS